MKKTTRLFLCAVLMTLLVTAVSFAVTTAWLAQNRKAESINQIFQLDPGDMKIRSLRVYRCDDGATETQIVPEQLAGESSATYHMSAYDAFFTETNQYRGLIFVFELIDIPENCTKIQVTCDGVPSADNVISTSEVTAFSWQASTTDEDVHTMRTSWPSTAQRFTFGDTTDEDGQAIRQASFDVDKNWQGNSVYLYLLLDYVPDLITAPTITAGMDLSEGSSLPYVNDLTKFTFLAEQPN